MRHRCRSIPATRDGARAAALVCRDGRRRGDRCEARRPACAARRHRAAPGDHAGAPAPASPPRRRGRAAARARTESLGEAAQSARRLAAGAETVEALAALVAGFDGCPLKRTATNTVFADGNPAAPVMIIGEAPGADEDRIGRPFVGRAGQLLDRMLAAIGLDRSGVSDHQRHLLAAAGQPHADRGGDRLLPAFRACATSRWSRPKVLVLSGGTAAGALLPQSQGITRLRGRWFDLAVPGLDRPVPTLPMFHPPFCCARRSASARPGATSCRCAPASTNCSRPTASRRLADTAVIPRLYASKLSTSAVADAPRSNSGI